MGACTSVPNDSDSSTSYRLALASKAKRFFLASPAKEQSLNEANPVDGFALKSPELGSKDEIFFDTQVWLDSDCEDDFFSVNGDFTPSRGNTPIHPLSMPLITPKLGNHFLFDKSSYSISEPSPTGRKKLAELLYETSQAKKLDSANVTEAKDATTKSDRDKTNTTQTSNSLSTSSACSSEVTPSRDLRSRKEKPWKAGHCCLLSLQNFGVHQRRQKMSVPVPVLCDSSISKL